MFRFWLYLILFVFALIRPSSAWDGLGDSGGLQPYPGQKTHVRLVSEKVRIQFLSLGQYLVLTDYVFENLGTESNVFMCLPVDDTMLDDGGYTTRNRAKPRFSVDNRVAISSKRKLTHSQARKFDAPYNLLWEIRVNFIKGQTRHVRLRYLSQTYGGCGDIMNYALASGKWKGRVAETVLYVANVEPAAGESVAYWATAPELGGHSINMQKRGGNIYKRWTKHQLNGAFTID